jgi:hypothetical protein
MSQIRILQPEDLPKITDLEKRLLAEREPDETEREFASWHASWRKESLEYYLPLGWSFGVWIESASGTELVGYYIAQPQLFTRGQTQTLWVEQLTATNDIIKDELKLIARRIAREKHFQKVIFNGEEEPSSTN